MQISYWKNLESKHFIFLKLGYPPVFIKVVLTDEKDKVCLRNNSDMSIVSSPFWGEFFKLKLKTVRILGHNISVLTTDFSRTCKSSNPLLNV